MGWRRSAHKATSKTKVIKTLTLLNVWPLKIANSAATWTIDAVTASA
jgi:hypothetical protein